MLHKGRTNVVLGSSPRFPLSLALFNPREVIDLARKECNISAKWKGLKGPAELETTNSDCECGDGKE